MIGDGGENGKEMVFTSEVLKVLQNIDRARFKGGRNLRGGSLTPGHLGR